MQWTVKLPDGQKLIIDKAFWTGKVQIRLDNGIIGKMGMTRQQSFKIAYKDGTEHSLTIKHCLLDPIPHVLLDGNDVMASKRFPNWQTCIICIPGLLILKLGALPALIGISGCYLNFFIARNDKLPPPLRWTAIGIVPVVGLIAVLLVSDLVWGTQQNSTTKMSSGYHIQTQAPTHQYDPTEDDNNPRLWAKPNPRAEEAERYVRYGPDGHE